ncbi:MAG: hypothetical protein VKK04_02710 [Synechococcales bacterium]|nr:hypothetical protein [Synechococcales bacterium]
MDREFVLATIEALDPSTRLDGADEGAIAGHFQALIEDLIYRQDAISREEWRILGEILSPEEFEALAQLTEDEIEAILDEWRSQYVATPYESLLDAQVEDQPSDTAGLLALATIGILWLWSPSRQQYRNTRSGRYLPKDRGIMRDLLTEEVDRTSNDLDRLSERLLSGRSSLEEWQEEVAQLLRERHTRVALLAVGGQNGMKPGMWTDLVAEIQRQFDYLRGFSMEIELGSQSPAQIQSRLRLYARSLRLTHEQMRAIAHQEAGFGWVKRVLGATDNHCQECLSYAGMGVVPIGAIPDPGQECRCRANCLCRHIYGRSLEELI